MATIIILWPRCPLNFLSGVSAEQNAPRTYGLLIQKTYRRPVLQTGNERTYGLVRAFQWAEGLQSSVCDL